jgi:acetyl-CoA C-acetyltransferase
MRKVAVISGGISRYARPRYENQEEMVAEAVKEALDDCPNLSLADIDNHVVSYFSDHFEQQLSLAWIIHDYLGLTPKPVFRVEDGGAGPIATIRAAWGVVSSGLSEVCLVSGVEKQGEVGSSKANEFIALASDTDFEFPAGGYYTGYYGAMAARHMYLYGETEEDLAKVAVKNRNYSLDNPYAQWPQECGGKRIGIDDVLKSRLLAWPLKILDCCLLSEGASCIVLASEDVARKYTDEPVWMTGIGLGSDMMRPGDRPDNPGWKGRFEECKRSYPPRAMRPREVYPEMANFGACRAGAEYAYKMAGIDDPYHQIDIFEIHDAYDSSELQSYEDLMLCPVGHGKDLIREEQVYVDGDVPVNPSGGLEGFGHPVGSTAIGQCVELLWQLRGQIGKKHFSERTQVKGAEVALLHSHAGTGTVVGTAILRR